MLPKMTKQTKQIEVILDTIVKDCPADSKFIVEFKMLADKDHEKNKLLLDYHKNLANRYKNYEVLLNNYHRLYNSLREEMLEYPDDSVIKNKLKALLNEVQKEYRQFY
jgi:hypothetical protein